MQNSAEGPHRTQVAAQNKAAANYAENSVVNSFRQAMQAIGIGYSGEIIADGRLHRFHIEGQKKGRENGAYVLHLDNNPYPAGWFMDFTTGMSDKWSCGGGFKATPMFLKQIEDAKRQREAETNQQHQAAANKASHIWNSSESIAEQSDHPYLVKKQIEPHGARLYKGSLVIPIYNESRQLVNLQFIDSEGGKRFLSGGRKRGCFLIIGNPTKRILICEGFATGASLLEYWGLRVVIALDAGNLLPVAENINKLSPDSEIIIAGDNDLSGVGQAKAREAALAIGGKILIPETPDTDWNDFLSGGSHA